jgi:hypothetical protein
MIPLFSSTSSKAMPNKSNWKTYFSFGMLSGFLLGAIVSSSACFVYLLVSQDMVSVKNGQVKLAKSVNSTTESETTNLNIKGNKNPVAIDGGVANSGENSQVARDPSQSFNRKDSPSIFGNNNTINISSNRELPGFDEKSYISQPPSDLSKYSEDSDFQPDSLIQSASDTGKIQFEKKDIVILGKPYKSFFAVNWNANESRFIFKLDGTHKAALLQFGLPDLSSGSTTNGVYTVKILADGKLIWASECRRSQGNQIISVPLDIAGKSALSIEVTSNGKNETSLFFTQARVFK